MNEVEEYVMEMNEVECDEFVKTFVKAMSEPTGAGAITAFDLLPKLEGLPTFQKIRLASKTNEEYQSMAKMVIDEALAQVGEFAMSTKSA